MYYIRFKYYVTHPLYNFNLYAVYEAAVVQENVVIRGFLFAQEVDPLVGIRGDIKLFWGRVYYFLLKGKYRESWLVWYPVWQRTTRTGKLVKNFCCTTKNSNLSSSIKLIRLFASKCL